MPNEIPETSLADEPRDLDTPPQVTPADQTVAKKPSGIPSYLMAGSAIITAVATALLAFYTYRTLNEVEAQRKIVGRTLEEQVAQRRIMAERLNLDKMPEVTISRPSPFEVGETVLVRFRVSNYGGPAGNIKFRVTIIGAENLEFLRRHKKDVLTHDGEHRQSVLTRNIALNWDLFYTKDDWVYKTVSGSDNKHRHIYAYARLECTGQFDIDSEKQRPIVISESYEWDPLTKHWGALPPNDQEKIAAFLGPPENIRNR